MDEMELVEWETAFGRQILMRVLRRIRQQGESDLAELLEAIYDHVEPDLIASRHGNPVHHTAKVLELLAELTLQERLTHADLKVLFTAATIHDAGFSRIPPDQPKIRLSDVEAIEDPEQREKKRAEAKHLRRRHADEGALIAEKIMDKLGGYSPEEVDNTMAMIRRHDDPSIAELELEPDDKRRWLFEPDDTLLWQHRSADRLWMLSFEGVLVDLRRDLSLGKRLSALERLHRNAKRHQEEADLYVKVLPDKLADYAFEQGSAFYRTPRARELYRSLQERTAEAFEAVGRYLGELMKPMLPT